jgi:hypothetical protein
MRKGQKFYKTTEIIASLVKMKIEAKASNKTMMDFLMNELKYSKQHSYAFMKSARDEIQIIWDKNVEHHLEEAKGQLEDMLEAAQRRKDFKLALEIRKELNKLMGIYQAEKIDITVTEMKAKFPGME